MRNWLALLCTGLLWIATDIRAQELLSYRPIPEAQPNTGLAPDTLWRITGVNRSEIPQLVILQISNSPKASYAQRINEERMLPPGDFSLEIYPAALLTPQGKTLDLIADTELILFTPQRSNHIEQLQLTSIPASPLAAAVAWDFGPVGSAVFQGFEPVDESDPRIQLFAENNKAKSFIRKGPDPLVSDGISGLRKLTLAAPTGRWQLHLWTEDYGEWQSLPMLTERRIRINGQDKAYQNISAREWIPNRYTANKYLLAGQLAESKTSTLLDSWQLLGQQRGGLISLPVESINGEITIELAGANRQATTLTALVLENTHNNVLRSVNQQRAAWFSSRWPMILPKQSYTAALDKVLVSASTPNFIELTLDRPYALSELTLEAEGLAPQLRQRLPLLKRYDGNQNNPSGGLLAVQYELLSADAPAEIRSPHFQIELAANPAIKPGHYALSLYADNNIKKKTLVYSQEVEVVSTLLPPADRPLGVYLEMPPHLEHNYDLKEQAPMQLACDIQQLTRLSLTGLAPPLPMPDSAIQQEAVINQIRSMEMAGIRMPLISYSGFKTLRYKYSANESGQYLQQLVQQLEQTGLESPAWSVADEPSNPSSAGGLVSTRNALLQGATDPTKMKTAAHLNNPKDKQWLNLLDIALINDGFGVDQNDIERVRQSGATPWFYNLPNSRVAAGFYAWKHNIGGYLQWHARMPTADPFDPTDGREDDQQLLPVMSQICSPVPDLDQKLVDLIQGITDFRWLRWLDQTALHYPEALRLKKHLLREIPSRWQTAEQLDLHKLDQWRQRIILLSKQLE